MTKYKCQHYLGSWFIQNTLRRVYFHFQFALVACFCIANTPQTSEANAETKCTLPCLCSKHSGAGQPQPWLQEAAGSQAASFEGLREARGLSAQMIHSDECWQGASVPGHMEPLEVMSSRVAAGSPEGGRRKPQCFLWPRLGSHTPQCPIGSQVCSVPYERGQYQDSGGRTVQR